MKPWTPRLSWGVTLDGNRIGMLGESWGYSEYRDGPTRQYALSRPLLFPSRSQARAWCAAKEASYAGRNDCCATWRFRPVRILESWEIVS